MAEPNNTPWPPGTPVPASTPRSGSPVPMPPTTTPHQQSQHRAGGSGSGSIVSLPIHSHSHGYTHGHGHGHSHGGRKPVVLHIGDPIRYNQALYAEFAARFEVVRPSEAERARPQFLRALRERRWGDFAGVFRPFWNTGGEMGPWDAELVAALPESCRVFAFAGAGFDWADTRLLGERGIIYCNSGLAAAEAVADFAVAMVISTFRYLPWCIGASNVALTAPADQARAAFERCHAQATGVSHTLRHHVLGLIGLGNIGRHIAAKLGGPAFGMRVHYHDVERKPAALEAELGIAAFHDSLAGLLAASDCAVLCAPAAPDGRPLITTEALRHARHGSRFVNVARGSLVDEDAVADALERGILSTAALDVHPGEPAVNPRLARMAVVGPASAAAAASADRKRGDDDDGVSPHFYPYPGRVMMTCHNAGGTVETHAGFEELSMRNIMAVLGGEEPITPVNMQWLRR